ncbi:ABC transporter permease [Patescibacteria group bacterium]
MNVRETLKTALDSLGLNKVRSFLTMLGVIIGVFAVVSLVSLVKGVQNYIEGQFEALGSNLIFVMSGNINTGSSTFREVGKSLGSSNLEAKHSDLIERYAASHIEAVTPATQLGKTVKYKTHDYYAQIVGVNYRSDYIFNTYAQEGRYFTKAEERSSARVAVIGYILNDELFGDENALGKKVKVEGKSYEIIGILGKKNPDYDESLIVPYTTTLDMFPGASIIQIGAKAWEDVDFEEAIDQVELALMRDLDDDEFTVMTQKDILESIESILSMLTVALAAISGISLLVGGIGIMNIMLVSVTERTREIGLRKALGATSKDIRLQFMIEAVVISMTGGVIGLFFGWITTIAISSLIEAEIPLWSVLMALGFSILVGIIFGTYPAVKASKKDPIEALRYE